MSNFWQRLNVGVRYALRGGKAVATMRPSWERNQPSYALLGNFTSMVEEGYYKNELIYACVVKSANSASQISLVVRKKKDRSLVMDHPLLELVKRPNEEMNEFDLWSSMVIYQKLAGRALYEKVRSRNRKKVVQLQPLRPDWVTIKPGTTTRIGSYFYQPPGTDGQVLEPQDVVDVPLFDPLRRFSTKSPLAVLGRSGDVDNAVTDFIKLFFEMGGVPMGLLKSKEILSDDDVKVIRARWRERYGGHQKWIDPAVLGADAEYQKTGLDFKEMGFEVLDERDEARICMVMDVPPIIVGARVGLKEATYSNYAQARKAWWEDSLSPMYVNYLDVIGRLLDETDPSGEYYVDWDFLNVKAFQEENNERWNRATNALRSGAITRNQFNAEVGLPGLGPKGDLYLMPLNVVEAPGGKPPVVSDQGAGDKGREEKKSSPEAMERRKIEGKIEAEMSKYFRGQFGRIKDKLNAAGS